MSFVTVKLFAQRGNWQFMIAACAAHAWKHGVDFKIPLEGHDPKLRSSPFPWLPAWTPADGLGAPYVEPPELFGQYHEMPYWPKMRLHGYFQNETYFRDYRQDVLRLFRMDQIETMINTVGIHVRRGDYLDHPTKFVSPNHEYLSKAIAYFDREYFSVFSDDIPWCKQYFSTHHPDRTFIYNEGNDAATDQLLLASCEHQIISASTFSWWSAWANPNPNKRVICPAVWFGPDTKLRYDLICPESWTRA